MGKLLFGVPFSHSAGLRWRFCALFFSVFWAPLLVLFVRPWCVPEINWLRQHLVFLCLSPFLPPFSFSSWQFVVCWVKNGHCQSRVVTVARGSGTRFVCVCVCLVSWAMCLAEEKFQLGRAWKLSIYPASWYIKRANPRTEMQNCYVWLLLLSEVASN